MLTACTVQNSSASLEEISAEQRSDKRAITPNELAFCDAFGVQGIIELVGGATDGDSPTDKPWSNALALAPSDLQDALQTLQTQSDNVDLTPHQAQQGMVAIQEVLTWTTAKCNTGPPVRYFAPSAAPAGWISCGDTSWFQGLDRSIKPGWSTVYGEASHPDPFAQPLIAVLTGIRLSPGDGPNTPVFVNGAEASAGAASVFQGVTSPELAHVISWVLEGT